MSNELEELYFETLTAQKKMGIKAGKMPEDPDGSDIIEWAVNRIRAQEAVISKQSSKIIEMNLQMGAG